MAQDTPDTGNLRKIYDQVHKADLKLLLSGMSILVRDTSDFLHLKGFQDPHSEEFRQVYTAMLDEDRYYWSTFGPELYKHLKDTKLPSGLVEKAYRGNFNLSELLDTKINKEYTRFPGWFFFRRYSQTIKSRILPEATVEEERQRIFESADDFEIVEEYVNKLVEDSTVGKEFWYPVMLYVSLLLLKSVLVTFKE